MIPWTTLLRHAPALLAAADTLLARARSSKPEAMTQGVEERLGRVEQGSRESAQLLRDIAQQINALTIAQEIAAKRARLGLILGIVALIVALCAGILAMS